jgi:uncharacterized protein (DUF1800 family)
MTRAPAQLGPDHAAALAAHRFGLGEDSLQGVGSDARGWLLAQTGPAEPQRGKDLAGGADAVRRYAVFLRQQREAAAAMAPDGAATRPAPAPGNEPLRLAVQADVRARLVTAALSTRPFNERLALFWANHFTVSLAKGSVRGVVGAYEREAIRPHIAGAFDTLLLAAVTHAGMLRYLDNDQSAGPRSAIVQRLARRSSSADERPPRVTGLNENLAREVLELHTLGVAGGGTAYGGWGGYTQADVTEFARVLTGWRVPQAAAMSGGRADGASRFDPAWHDPGPKTVLGRRYEAGPEALPALLSDLARHPSTARFLSFKLARHFVADTPPPALVARLEKAYLASGGELPALVGALLDSPEAWLPQPAKLKTPEEFVVSTVRLLGLGAAAFERAPDAGINALGQRVQGAPSPAGWPDTAEDWLGPDAMWKRVEWATRVADRVGRRVDARELARASLGPLLGDDTARQIERAADGPQALALLLLSPEFQRR